MKINLLQIDSIDTNSAIYKNIALFYSLNKNIGYYKHSYFLEYPTWMLYTAGVLINCDVKAIVMPYGAIPYLDCDYCFISIMSSNKKDLLKIVTANPHVKFIAGDYTNDNYDYENLTIVNTVKSICNMAEFREFTDIRRYGILDYSIFNVESTIPRIQLSTGCNHNCKFCTVPNKVKSVSTDLFVKQDKSLSKLGYDKFKLIYLDDKTFGQSDSRILISYFSRKYSAKFIVQTSFFQLNKLINGNDFIFEFIEVVEIGLESYNEKILKGCNKPLYKSLKESVDLAFKASQDFKFKLIFNIIVGLPEETIYTYIKTLLFLYKNRSKLFNINIFPYADYTKEGIESEYTLKGIHKIALKLFLKIQRLIILKK